MNCKKGFKHCTQIGCDCFAPFAKPGIISKEHRRMILEAPSLAFMTQSVRDEIAAYIHKLNRVIEACETEIEYQANAYDELASEVREWFHDRPQVWETLDKKCYPSLAVMLDD